MDCRDGRRTLGDRSRSGKMNLHRLRAYSPRPTTHPWNRTESPTIVLCGARWGWKQQSWGRGAQRETKSGTAPLWTRLLDSELPLSWSVPHQSRSPPDDLDPGEHG